MTALPIHPAALLAAPHMQEAAEGRPGAGHGRAENRAPAGGPAPLVAAVREMRPGDAGLVDRLYEQLGAQSRYQRFHGPKPRLTSADRSFLAGADGRDHVALVALDAVGGPVGMARFVRVGDGRTADIAAEVADALQHRGIGTDLMVRLARRAAALGVQRFSADVLSESRLRGGLVRRGWKVRSFDGPSTTLEVDVWRLLRA